MSNITFIRGLWGSGKKLEKTMEYVKGSDEIDSAISPKIYVFGEDNYNTLVGLNKVAEILDSNPNPYSDDCRTKLAIIEKAVSEFGEVMFVDWHIRLKGRIPDSMQDLSGGAPVKAALRMYKQRHCKWREQEQRKVSASDFLYIKNLRAVNELIETWETMDKPVTLEEVVMKYIDHLTGGWRGVDYYNSYFEIPYFRMSWEKELYSQEKEHAVFISLKDVKEVEAQAKKKTKDKKKNKREVLQPQQIPEQQIPEPVLSQPVQEIQEKFVELSKEHKIDRQPVVKQVEQLDPSSLYSKHPIEMDTWTTNFTNVSGKAHDFSRG